MKRVVAASEPIYAMAIVNPQLCKNESIQIEVEQRDEGPIPHLHIYLDKTRNPNNCAYIRLDTPEYAPHHSSVKLSKKEKKAFLKVMKEKWPRQFVQSTVSDEVRTATGYEAAVTIWIDTFGGQDMFKFDESGFPIMPDYSTLD